MDPDPGGPKTYGSDGSGSATLATTTSEETKVFYVLLPHIFYVMHSGRFS